jgi:uncharacterized protein
MSHVATVQAIYEAFGRGDIPAILERMAENVVWEQGDEGGGHGVPWLAPRRGRAGVQAFFEALAPLEFTQFVPKELFGAGDTVVALLDVAARVKGSDRGYKEIDEVHIFRFDAAGRVVGFRHRVDTVQHVAAAAR